MMEKEELAKEVDGEILTTAEATEKYEFISFLAPFVVVRRKSDQVKGTLMFQDRPRFYFSFEEEL